MAISNKQTNNSVYDFVYCAVSLFWRINYFLKKGRRRKFVRTKTI